MANVFGQNLSLSTGGDWRAIWELSLRLIKAGWVKKASSDGSAKEVSDDPSTNKWAALTTIGSGSGAQVTAVVAHPNGYMGTMTGLSGLVAPTSADAGSEGRFVQITGSSVSANNAHWQIVEVVSATSCKAIYLGSGTPSADTGSDGWTEKGITTATYSASLSTSVAWLVLEGPHTIQLKCTTQPGVFQRGEQVTQATSGAKGECLGVVWDATSTTGWIVIAPREGTFNNSNVVTGDTSGATITPTALRKYRRQMVLYKAANTTQGVWYYGVFRDDTEGTSLFSALASNVNCTATIPPGGTTTAGNQFPGTTPLAYVVRGTNTTDSAGALTATEWFGSGLTLGRAQVSCANAMPRASRSADGSFTVYVGVTSVAGQTGIGYHFGRTDGGPPGDVEPYAWLRPANASGLTQRVATGQAGANAIFTWDSIFGNSSYASQFAKVQNKADGSAVAASFVSLKPSMVCAYWSATTLRGAMENNHGATLRETSHPAATPPAVREPLGLQASFGRFRWLMMINAGTSYDTWDTKQWVQFVTADPAASKGGIVFGPWDGSTVPVQS